MGCRYCGELHSQLYTCDAERKARDMANKPAPSPNSVANTSPDMANDMANSQSNVANTHEPMANKTYRYRDPEKRRAYMRDYMKRKRAEQEDGKAEL